MKFTHIAVIGLMLFGAIFSLGIAQDTAIENVNDATPQGDQHIEDIENTVSIFSTLINLGSYIVFIITILFVLGSIKLLTRGGRR